MTIYTDDAPETETIYNVSNFNNTMEFDGEGMLIAIIYTGLDYTHEAFLTDPSCPALNKDTIDTFIASTCANSLATNAKKDPLTADSVYINAKIPFAYDYANNDTDVMPKTASNGYHGTHVADIAAGNSPTFRGVAPNAQIAAMKVFSDSASSATTSTILATLCDAVIIDADVINLSLGSVAGLSYAADELTNQIYQAIEDANILVAASAGNSYNTAMGSNAGDFPVTENPDYGIVSSLSTYEGVISVASANSHIIEETYLKSDELSFTYISAYNSLTETTYNIFDFINAGTYELVNIENYGSADAYENTDVKGKIVITQRGGGLSFEEKDLAAYNAGAAGIIIYDNVTGYGINMVVAPENMKIACVYVSKEAGEALINQKTVTFSEEFIKSTPSMSTFSSWGPTPELQIKPEITGIGGSVYSAYTNGGYAYASGTSMASPYVAGILALVKQSIQANYPSLTDEEIYNAVYQRVMSTADILTDLNGNYYPVRQQGAGLINAVSAIESEAYIYVQNSSKTKIELGDDKECRGIYNLTFRVMNLSASPITYFVDPIVLADEVSSDGYTLTQMGKVLEGAAYTVRVAEGGSADGYYITVDAQGYAVVTVRIELSEKDKAYITDNFEYGTYVEGWVILRPSDAEKCTLSIPYLTFFGDWTSLPILDSDIYNLDDTLTTGTFLYAYNYFYYFVPGSYTFSLPDGYEKPEADMDKAALSFDSYFEYKNYESTAAIFLGTRRNITGATIEIRNAISGEVYAIYESNTGISKSYYSEDNYVLSGYYIYFSPYDLHIPGNSLIEINVKVYANYLEDPQYKNNDTYSMTFRVDYESPTIENVTTEWVDDKLILSFDTWDEYYIQCATMAAINMSNWEKNLGAKYGIVNNYAVYFPAMSNGFKYPFIPAYTDKGETASFIFDITSIYYEYLSNPDAYTYAITVYDYALNPVTYCLDLSNLGKIEAFELDRTEITLDINEYTELVPLFTPNENVNKDVTWSVDNPEVISLENGRILALSAGTATVTAVTANGELSAQCVVTVTQNFASPYYAETITLDTESLSLVENSSYTLTIVSVEPWYTTNKNVLFASSDESVATVDENGKITGISEGNAIITVSAADGGGAQALCNVQVTSGYSEFTIEGTILKAYSGNAAVVVVPEEVTDIGTVFMNNTYIQKVILPEGITQLANYAFYNCTNLAEINIPANVTTIGNYCFDYCGSLSTVIFEGTALTSIGNYSFAFTTSLKAIDLPEGLTTINTAAFNASGIEEIVMPSTLSVIGDGAFYYALALRSVTFNEGLENICREAFYGCSSLKEIIIPDSVTSISRYSVTSAGSTSSNYYTFANCTSLERVVLGSNVTKIGKYTFYGCSSLKEIEWGGVTALYGYAFAACGFEELTLPEQITSFNTYAFADNVNLKKVYYYSSVSQNYLFANCTSLETVAIKTDQAFTFSSTTFSGCTSLAAFYVDENNASFTVIDNFLVRTDTMEATAIPGILLTQEVVTIPEGITTFPAVFQNDTALKTVYLPSTITSLPSSAFSNCSSLENVIFADNCALTSLPTYTFRNCSALTKISLPDNLETLGNYVFYGCTALTEIEFPDSLLSIGNYVFQNCSSLKKVYFPENLTSIGSYAFNKCSSLTDVKLPESLISIGNYAFSACTSLEVINLPDNLTSISDYAFSQCTSLKEIDFPENVVSIGKYAFQQCYSLQNISIPEGLASIGNYAFYQCSLLNEISLPDSVNSIGTGAFKDCVELKSLRLPASLSNVPASIISGTLIESITIPASVTAIDAKAFDEAYELREFIVEEGNENFSVRDGILFSGETPYILPNVLCGDDETWTVPEYFTSLPSQFFAYKTAGTVVIPSTVTEMVQKQLFYFSYIKEIIIETPITSIGDQMFYYAKGLEKIVIPDSVTTIGNNAFSYCDALKEVIIPESVVSIGTTLFANCNSINYLEIRSSCPDICNIFASPNMYETSSGVYLDNQISYTTWTSSLETLIIAGNDYFTVVDNVLYTKDMKTLVLYPGGIAQNEFTVPEGVTRIEALAFRENDNLTKVILPESLVSIGHKAFYSCAALKTFEFRSFEAPILENIVGYSVLYTGIYTDNFLTNIADADGSLEMIRPSNGKGYDSKYYLTYFGTVQLSEEVYEPAAKELAATILNTQVFSLDDSDNIAQLRAAYDALSDAQKAHMGSEVLAKLTELENSIALLVSQAADLSAANVINDAIDIYFNSQYPSAQDMLDAIGKIMTDYDALTENQKDYVNYDVMLYGYDLAEANIVSEAIAVLSAGSDKTDIENVRAAYEALNDTQKALVNNYSDLLTAEYNMLQSAYDEGLKTAEDAEKAAQEAQKEIEDLKEQLRTSIISCQGESDAFSITAALLLAVACAVLIIIKKKNKISNK